MAREAMGGSNLELEGEAYGQPLLNWKIHEYPFYQRDKSWYWFFGAVAVVLLFLVLTPSAAWPDVLAKAPLLRNFFFPTANYTFAILIVLIAVVVIMNGRIKALEVDFIITTEGVIIGHKFYDYDVFKEFSIIYKPAENLKLLYLESKSAFMPRLSIDLAASDPLTVRKILLDYLDEDLVRTDEANSDYFGRFFKL